MSFLRATLTVSNVCHIFNVASFYQLKELTQACTSFVDTNAPQVMKSDGFASIGKQALFDLVSRDSFFAPEYEIFCGIQKWMESNECSPEDGKELLQVVRLPLINMLLLINEVRDSKLFEASEILDAIKLSHNSKNYLELNHRGLLSE